MANEKDARQQPLHSDLSDYMSLNRFPEAQILFEEKFEDIDVTYGGCRYFRFTIRYENTKMLQTLFQKLETMDLSSEKSNEIKEVINDALDQFGSEKMKKCCMSFLKDQTIHLALSNFMSLNRFTEAKTLLDSSTNIDIMHGNCVYFYFAIRYQNQEMLKTLFEILATNMEQNYFTFKQWRQLQKHVKDALNQFGSEEIEQLTNAYFLNH